MSERPILFSGPMIRALLDGRKTQTRRVVKAMAGEQSKWLTPELLGKVPSVEVGTWTCGFGVQLQHPQGGPLGWVRCPYGVRGDRLWVREAWAINHFEYCGSIPATRPQVDDEYFVFRATEDDPEISHEMPWRPSIHMPRWASRLTLEITEVRVQRLQDISDDDAEAEGIREPSLGETAWVGAFGYDRKTCPAEFGFAGLWADINGLSSYLANPWVWAISFEVAQ
jgi:hypothetical protein